ncbi:elongation factor Tu [Spartinivicinus ruber]|uniref:elongation factor Tu n=1 Tax=Spartinivicinus ruber TaxID=2683272 RepID=UPI001CA412B4|nr:elongation factor Tu [Spartinivicinus ruber]
MNENEKLEKLKKHIADNNLRNKYSNVQFDAEAEVYFLSTEEGGRHTPAIIGYSPNHLMKDDYLTSGLHVYLDQDYVFPGHIARTGIVFITPEVYPHCLSVGMKIRVQEASRLIGYAKITKIFNKILEIST